MMNLSGVVRCDVLRGHAQLLDDRILGVVTFDATVGRYVATDVPVAQVGTPLLVPETE